MAAIVQAPEARWSPRRPTGPSAGPPRLVVLEGGARQGGDARKHDGCSLRLQRIYRRRRLVVAALAFIVATLLLVGGWLATQRLVSSWLATAAPAAAASQRYVVVQPGDTLWSIALRLRPGHDPRPLVDQLAARRGSGPLRPGERIPVGPEADGSGG